MSSLRVPFCHLASVVILLALALTCMSTGIHAALTAVQAQQLKQDLDFYAQFLNRSVLAARSLFSANPPVPTSCAGFDVACNPTSVSVPLLNFSLPIPADYDKVQFRQLSSSQNYTTRMADVCAFNAMKTTWQNNRAGSDNKLLYQYGALSPDGLFAQWPMDTWSCDTQYLALTRPWAITSVKDLIILIDVSATNNDGNPAVATARLALSKQVADALVGGLSYRDHAAVIAYADAPDPQVTVMRRGSVDNIDLFKSEIANITLSRSSDTNVGAALQQATSVFATSKRLGATSGCTRIVVILTSGYNSIETPLPGTVLGDDDDDDSSEDQDSGSNKVILMPFLVADAASGPITQQQTNLVRGLACATRGITRTFRSSASDMINVSSFTDYFSALRPSSAEEGDVTVRVSEIYADAGSQGRVLSLSAPVYTQSPSTGITSLKAVLALDIKFSTLSQNGLLQERDVNEFNLAAATCTPLHQRDPINSFKISQLQRNESCSGINLAELGFGLQKTKSLPAIKALPAVAIAIAIVVLQLGGAAFYLINSAPTDGKAQIACVSLVIYFLTMLIALCILFSLVYGDLVLVHHYRRATMQMMHSKCTAFTSCEIHSCSDDATCKSAADEDPPCAERLSKLTSGSCGAGYRCCRSVVDRRCNCRDERYQICTGTTTGSSGGGESCTTETKKVCSTCTTCERSTPQRLCSTRCGTAYHCRASGEIRIIQNGASFTSNVYRRCALREATSCRTAFLAEFVLGSETEVFVSPESKAVRLPGEVQIRMPPLIAFIVFTVFSFLALALSFYSICTNNDVRVHRDNKMQMRKNKYSWDTDSDWSSGRKHVVADSHEQQQPQQANGNDSSTPADENSDSAGGAKKVQVVRVRN